MSASPPRRRRAARKLPWRQFTILSMVRFAEPIAMTSVFPYLPSMIGSFPRVKTEDIGFWTGVAAAMFSLAQCLTAISWGRASDRYGRKPILLLGLFCTMCTSLLWGLSTSLPLALLARALQGAGNGNVGIIRTVVAEICPWKELQPRAFSIMPMVYSLGSIIGPMIGTLANPLDRQPGDSAAKHSSLLWKFPYALPNLLSAVVFMLSIIIGFLFLNESLEAKKEKPDIGVMLGQRLIRGVNYFISRLKQAFSRQPMYTALPISSSSQERISRHKDVESASGQPHIAEAPPSYTSVLNSQTVLYLAVYTALAMHNTGFDQMISVLMHHPRSGPLVGKTELPFRFSKGFGMDTQKIGLLFTVNGCVGTLVQFLVFPRVARYLGTLNCLRLVLHLQTLVYVATPYTTLIEDEKLALTAFFCVWIVKSACSIMAFPCCTILLTNSATSLRTLATVNGVATSVSAIGRAVGPSITGAAFTWGVKSGLLITPFVALVIMAVLAFTPLYFASEGAGFGSDDDKEDYEDEETSDSDEDRTAEHRNSKLRSGKAPVTSHRLHNTSKRMSVSRGTSQTPHDEKALLRGILRDEDESSSSAIMSDMDDDDHDINDDVLQASRAQVAPDVQFLTAGDHLVSPRLTRTTTVPDTEHRKTRRRSTTPIGDGIGVRRLSSNLGVSRSGYGSGSEL